MAGSNTENLQKSLEDWLSKEGYPLEYYAASKFREAGLSVLQGEFYRQSSSTAPREVDITASAVARVNERFIRLSNIVECKWSGDKPVVLFTSKASAISTTACISQSFASDVGDALLYLARGDREIQKLSIFSTPARPAYGGRQAFGSKDNFYSAMNSVTSACTNFIKGADKGYESAKFVGPYCLISFPVIIIEGRLFEASYDEETHELRTHEVGRSRCHWRGAPEWPLHATIDIVTRDHLEEFTKNRGRELIILTEILAYHLARLVEAFERKDTSIIFGQRGGTGRSGLPRILEVLYRSENDSSD